MVPLRRLARALSRELWQCPLPNGLVSWRYLMRGQDPRVRLHRLLWWRSRPGWPRPAWLVIELWLWLRWVGFAGWRFSWRALRRRGATVRTREGISLWRQARALVALAVGRCIPPGDVYRFRLYRFPERAWDYVYDHEAAAFHRWRSRFLGDGGASRALLADKRRQSEVLAELKVPMAPILACVPRGTNTVLEPWLTKGERLFCKTRSGSCGIGAFTAWQRGDAIEGRSLSGGALPDTAAVERAWGALLELDDTLIQPWLPNHPRLAPLAAGEDAITVRYISCRQEDRYGCLSATLEVPAGWDGKSGRPLYVILPIEPKSGEIRPLPDFLLLDPEARERHAWSLARLPAKTRVPDWGVLVEASIRAHHCVPNLWAVAWDWVVSPDGPLLLEGNSGWGVATPQMLSGGFLAAEML